MVDGSTGSSGRGGGPADSDHNRCCSGLIILGWTVGEHIANKLSIARGIVGFHKAPHFVESSVGFACVPEAVEQAEGSLFRLRERLFALRKAWALFAYSPASV